MADGATMKTPDLDAFLAEIQSMPDAIRKRLVVGAVATAARIVRDASKAEAPEWKGDVTAGHPPPGTLKNAIYMARLINRCTPALEVWAVDVKSGRRTVTRGKNKGAVTNNQDAYYAVWVEYGHWTRIPGSTNRQHRAAVKSGMAGNLGAKFIPPNPFMRRAFEANKQRALNAMGDYIVKNLPSAMAAFKYIKAIS